jgi:hypothetical protein
LHAHQTCIPHAFGAFQLIQHIERDVITDKKRVVLFVFGGHRYRQQKIG